MLLSLQWRTSDASSERPVRLERLSRRAKAPSLLDVFAADRFVAERGGRFCHFLQPSVYVQEGHSEYELQVIENDRRLVDGLAAGAPDR